MSLLLEAFRFQITGNDEKDPPLTRLASDFAHLAAPVLSWRLLDPIAGGVVGVVMGGKQFFDGWRPGHGKRGGSFVDLGLVVVSLLGGWFGAPWGGSLIVASLFMVSALRAWQQRRWKNV